MRALNETIDFLTKQIEQLEAELAEIASAEFDKQLKTLTSIKGIGITLATSLILTTGGFTFFRTMQSNCPASLEYVPPTNNRVRL